LVFRFVKRKRTDVINTHISSSIDDATDVLIHGKIESYLLMIKEKLCPENLLVYSANAVAEYQSYLNLYREWELKDGKKPQKLIPFSLLPRSLKVDPKK